MEKDMLENIREELEAELVKYFLNKYEERKVKPSIDISYEEKTKMVNVKVKVPIEVCKIEGDLKNENA